MSKQLSISAAFSTLAMLAFVLSATPSALQARDAETPTGIAASALHTIFPKL